jgi:hypothetical protein
MPREFLELALFKEKIGDMLHRISDPPAQIHQRIFGKANSKNIMFMITK